MNECCNVNIMCKYDCKAASNKETLKEDLIVGARETKKISTFFSHSSITINFKPIEYSLALTM